MKDGLKRGDGISHITLDPETKHKILWKYVVVGVDENNPRVLTVQFVGMFDLNDTNPSIAINLIEV